MSRMMPSILLTENIWVMSDLTSRLVTILVVCLLASCQSEVTSEQYIDWLHAKENGLLQLKEVGGYNLELLHQPCEFLQIVKKKSETTPSAKAGDGCDDLITFRLRVWPKDSEKNILNYGTVSAVELQRRISFYSFEFQNRIWLEVGGEKFYPALFHFERNYDVSNKRTFVIAFEKPSAINDWSFVIDNSYFGAGMIRFLYEKDLIQAIPKLEVES